MAIIHNGDFIFHVGCSYYAMASFYLLPPLSFYTPVASLTFHFRHGLASFCFYLFALFLFFCAQFCIFLSNFLRKAHKNSKACIFCPFFLQKAINLYTFLYSTPRQWKLTSPYMTRGMQYIHHTWHKPCSNHNTHNPSKPYISPSLWSSPQTCGNI